MTNPITATKWKILELDDKEIITSRLDSYQPLAGHLTFTNLILWKDYYQFQWGLYEDILLIQGISSKGNHLFLQPIGSTISPELSPLLLSWLAENYKENTPSIIKTEERFLANLSSNHNILGTENRDDFDYLYNKTDLVELKGKKYHSKKNHLNAFDRNYNWQFQPLDNNHIDECIAIAETWYKTRTSPEQDTVLQAELKGITYVLNNRQHLRMQGGVILINGHVEAFSLGDTLNNNTAVIHIEKANPAIPHLSSLINQQSSQNTWGDLEYINRENDVGDPGLRQAKLSYRPIELIKKFTITLKSS
ncbi:MAG: phosphatidylglycerol lysyltransferase domain-containing protein [bacterium]